MSRDDDANDRPIDELGRVVAFWPGRVSTVRPVPIFIRGLVLVVDTIVLAIFFGILNGLLRTGWLIERQFQPAEMWIMASALLAMVQLLTSASPGKWLCGVRIATANGGSVGRGRRAARFVIWLVVLVGAMPEDLVRGAVRSIEATAHVCRFISFVITWGFIAAAFPPRKMLHDWLTGTAVFYRSDLVADGGAIGFPVVQDQDHRGAAEDAEVEKNLPTN